MRLFLAIRGVRAWVLQETVNKGRNEGPRGKLSIVARYLCRRSLFREIVSDDNRREIEENAGKSERGWTKILASWKQKSMAPVP